MLNESMPEYPYFRRGLHGFLPIVIIYPCNPRLKFGMAVFGLTTLKHSLTTLVRQDLRVIS